MVIRTKQCYKSLTDYQQAILIDKACHLSNNLYNEANYLVRQEFFANKLWIRYTELNKHLKASNNYKTLPAQTAQQLLKLVEYNWKAFFASMKEWAIDPDKFLARPKPPNYRDKGGKFLLILTNQQLRFRGNDIILPEKLGELKINFTKMAIIADKIRGMRIIPATNSNKGNYCFEILYKKDIPTLEEQNNRIASIDLGINNFITMANNIGEKPIIIKGKVIKSINQYFNKRKSKLQSIYKKQGIKTKNGDGKKLLQLSFKRKKRLNDKIHKASRFVINWCIANNIDTLIVGYNQNWKQKISIGKRNNQNFANIPFYKLVNQLKYKGEEEGINFITVEESYTSKCSFLDNEPLHKQKHYQGKRIKRGLFRSAKGLLINADVNAAFNILRKVFPNALNNALSLNRGYLAKGIVGTVHYPECYNL